MKDITYTIEIVFENKICRSDDLSKEEAARFVEYGWQNGADEIWWGCSNTPVMFDYYDMPMIW